MQRIKNNNNNDDDNNGNINIIDISSHIRKR